MQKYLKVLITADSTVSVIDLLVFVSSVAQN